MDRKGLSTPPPAIRSEEFISLASAVNGYTIDSTTMRRMVMLSSGDLLRSFRTALNTLADAGIQMRPGTKLLTRYAVRCQRGANFKEISGVCETRTCLARFLLCPPHFITARSRCIPNEGNTGSSRDFWSKSDGQRFGTPLISSTCRSNSLSRLTGNFRCADQLPKRR